MNRLGRAVVIVCLGMITARLLFTGGYGWFVQQRMQIPLILAAIVLLIIGGIEALQATREEQSNPDSMSRHAGPAVGWMLMLPIFVLVSVAPTALGAAAAQRVEAFTPPDTTERFEPIDSSAGIPEMRLSEFIDRAHWDEQKSLKGTPIRLEGLVVNDDDITDGFKLTRFMVSCCAADGIPIQVALRGIDATYADDTWVVVDVEWIEPEVPYFEADGPRVVEAQTISLTTVDSGIPNDPYESPYDD